jgi:hypothetical protein
MAQHSGAFVQPLLQSKTTSIAYPESVCVCVCVCVALDIQHAMRLRHIVIVAWPGQHIFPHYIINGMIFEKIRSSEHKNFLYDYCLKHF